MKNIQKSEENIRLNFVLRACFEFDASCFEFKYI